MKKEEKDLLLKDLCSRLPYGVKLETLEGPQEFNIKWLSINMCNIASPYLPYLLPLSSMTEEQKEEFRNKFDINIDISKIFDGIDFCGSISFRTISEILDWLNKNHFDYRGLIPKGLALDATGKDIY